MTTQFVICSCSASPPANTQSAARKRPTGNSSGVGYYKLDTDYEWKKILSFVSYLYALLY